MSAVKILIVDDNPDIIEMVSLRLEANDYEVIGASNGPEALEKARTLNPDLILLDITMPQMDGFEVGRRLKADSNTADIPIIIVSARGKRSDIVKAITDAKADDYIVKPFRPEILLEKVRKVLGES